MKKKNFETMTENIGRICRWITVLFKYCVKKKLLSLTPLLALPTVSSLIYYDFKNYMRILEKFLKSYTCSNNVDAMCRDNH